MSSRNRDSGQGGTQGRDSGAGILNDGHRATEIGSRNQPLHGFLLNGLDIKCEEMLVLYSKYPKLAYFQSKIDRVIT